jgi:poly-gamma-glutamate system protein
MSLKIRDPVICALGLLSALFLAGALVFAARPLLIRDAMLSASRRMEEAVKAVRNCRESRGIGIDPVRDINRTGLIGLENSIITTSLGSLEAKRTTTNPNFAGLVTLLLHQAGVRKGGVVAIGASSSFPALIIASLCAVQAMEARGLLICSLGASQWGANQPDFNWLDILECLRQSGRPTVDPIAISLGGDQDMGRDMSPEGRTLLLRMGKATGLPFISEPDLERNVRERLRIFERAAGEAKIEAFINIGGSYSNMGTDSDILKVGPGLATVSHFPPPERRGVIFEMAARGIPVIHLLYVKGLCDRYGLPWDPSPLPQAGRGDIFKKKEVDSPTFRILAAAYLLAIALVLVIGARS